MDSSTIIKIESICGEIKKTKDVQGCNDRQSNKAEVLTVHNKVHNNYTDGYVEVKSEFYDLSETECKVTTGIKCDCTTCIAKALIDPFSTEDMIMSHEVKSQTESSLYVTENDIKSILSNDNPANQYLWPADHYDYVESKVDNSEANVGCSTVTPFKRKHLDEELGVGKQSRVILILQTGQNNALSTNNCSNGNNEFTTNWAATVDNSKPPKFAFSKDDEMDNTVKKKVGATKYCVFGSCNSDSRQGRPGYIEGQRFFKFPKPCLEFRKSPSEENLQKHTDSCDVCKTCDKWVKSCKRIDGRFEDIYDVKKDTYICQQHFPAGTVVLDPENMLPVPKRKNLVPSVPLFKQKPTKRKTLINKIYDHDLKKPKNIRPNLQGTNNFNEFRVTKNSSATPVHNMETIEKGTFDNFPEVGETTIVKTTKTAGTPLETSQQKDGILTKRKNNNIHYKTTQRQDTEQNNQTSRTAITQNIDQSTQTDIEEENFKMVKSSSAQTSSISKDHLALQNEVKILKAEIVRLKTKLNKKRKKTPLPLKQTK